MRTLLIDDMRNLDADFTARNYDDGIKALKSRKWDVLLLDHDIASYNKSGREMTGYDIICWLEENTSFLPKQIKLVTSNPVGRQRMNQVISRLYRKF